MTLYTYFFFVCFLRGMVEGRNCEEVLYIHPYTWPRLSHLNCLNGCFMNNPNYAKETLKDYKYDFGPIQ